MSKDKTQYQQTYYDNYALKSIGNGNGPHTTDVDIECNDDSADQYTLPYFETSNNIENKTHCHELRSNVSNIRTGEKSTCH
jgi:hypothetical protein